MMISHVLITTADTLRNNVYASYACITLPVCSHLVNAICFGHSTAFPTLWLNLILSQITMFSWGLAKQNFK